MDKCVLGGLWSVHTIGDKFQVFHISVDNVHVVILLSTNLWTAPGRLFVVSIRQMAGSEGGADAKKPSRGPAGLLLKRW